MKNKNPENESGKPVVTSKKPCSRERALQTLRYLERGTQQTFLDGELDVADTKQILDQIKEARQRCETGDADACLILDKLVAGLAKEREE